MSRLNLEGPMAESEVLNNEIAAEVFRKSLSRSAESPGPLRLSRRVHEFIHIFCDKVLKLDPEIKYYVARMYEDFLPKHILLIHKEFLAQTPASEPMSWESVFVLNASRQTLRLFSIVLIAYRFCTCDDNLTEKIIYHHVPIAKRKKFKETLQVKSQKRVLETLDYNLHVPNLHSLTLSAVQMMTSRMKLDRKRVDISAQLLLDLLFVVQTPLRIRCDMIQEELAAAIAYFAVLISVTDGSFTCETHEAAIDAITAIVAIDATKLHLATLAISQELNSSKAHRKTQQKDVQHL